MPWHLFLWDPETEEHLGEQGVTPEEFEEVVSNPDAVGESKSTGRPIAFGYRSTGKYLACVNGLVDPDTVLAVTAYEVQDWPPRVEFICNLPNAPLECCRTPSGLGSANSALRSRRRRMTSSRRHGDTRPPTTPPSLGCAR